MKIEFVAIHEINKKEKETTANLALSDSFVDHTNEDIQNIIRSLDLSFSKKTLRRAKFSDDGFKSHIVNLEKTTFLAVSKNLMGKLKDGLQNIPAAKGGYLIFCNYTTTKNFLAVFLVRNKNGNLFSYKGDDRTWNVNSTEYLDFDHFAMGVKINLDTFNSNSDERYISFAKGNTDISDYFLNWVGIDDSKQEMKDGDTLYEVSNGINLPEGIADRKELKKKIFEYINSKPSQVVNLRDLSQHLYDDDNAIQKYCDEKNIDIDGEFKLTKKQLEKFYKIYIKAGGIELSAARSIFDTMDVASNGETVLIRSKELAEEIIRIQQNE
ncbi:MAG: nucleoid-associated protein [Methylococcales bacterium]|nr:nucleoid-associated protein [Methylococcales bacterium]